MLIERWIDKEEKDKLYLKCRTSGKTDNQWLKENNIKAPTFYYYVKQLRKKACELPEAEAI